MDTPKKRFAWQPLTPGGISVFAGATFGRVWLVQLLFALICSGTVVWVVQNDWFPVCASAIKQLPPRAEIRRSKLQWESATPVLLGENRFLAISVDMRHEGKARFPAHVAIELGQSDYKVFSLLGYVSWKYPSGWRVLLSRTDAVPWWGAWTPAILALIGAAVAAALMVFWTILALIYCGPVWLAASFLKRDLKVGGSWRLAGTALLPGSLLLSAGIVAYGLGWFDVIGLFVAVAFHLLLGWIFLASAMLKLPGQTASGAGAENPFAAPANDKAPETSPPPAASNEGGSIGKGSVEC